MNKTETVKAAIVQYPPVFLNLEASIAKAVKLIEDSASEGSELIVFPETWLPGYPLWIDSAPKAAMWDYPPAKALFNILFENSLEIPGGYFNNLLDAAKKNNIFVVMGANEKAGGTIFNTMIFINREGEYKIHRKLVPTYTERMMWGRGDGSTLNTMETGFGTVGGLICWEHWMPFARAAMHDKNETIHIALWPAVRDLHQIASRHYAFEGQCFVLAAGMNITKAEVLEGFDSIGINNQASRELLESIEGDQSKILYNGGSTVIAPDTSYISEPVFNKQIIIYADLDLKLINEGRMTMDTSGHYSRPDVFKLIINDEKQNNISYKYKGGN